MRDKLIKEYFVGKTIERVEFVDPCTIDTCPMGKVDDDPYLKLIFTDKTWATLIPGYRDYTGKSLGEYPTDWGLLKGKEDETNNSGIQDSN